MEVLRFVDVVNALTVFLWEVLTEGFPLGHWLPLPKSQSLVGLCFSYPLSPEHQI